MNEFLFKNANEKIIKLVKRLKEQIDKTYFDGKVYLVGGAVRDLLLGKQPHDFDIVVNIENGGTNLANFLAVRNRCWEAGKNPIVFETFGTASLRLTNDDEFRDISLEFVETRKNQFHSRDLIKGSVFGTLEEDSKRRDLTINSIYYNISTDKIIDFNGGMFDIEKKIIRTPSHPTIIFLDDPCRMLRAIRLASDLGFGIDKETWLGIIKNAPKIALVAKERTSTELSKMLVSDGAASAMRRLYYGGLLHRMMPDIYETVFAYESRPKVYTTFEHTLDVLSETQPILEHRLAALFHDVGKAMADKDRTLSADKFSSDVASFDLKEMKFSNRIVKAVETAIRYHNYFSIYADGVMPSDKKIRRFLNHCGDNMAITLDLMNANNLHLGADRKVKQVLDIVNRIEELQKEEENATLKLPITASDIMAEFKLKGGPWIGTILSEVKEAYIDNPKITKDECFEIAETVLHKLY